MTCSDRNRIKKIPRGKFYFYSLLTSYSLIIFCFHRRYHVSFVTVVCYDVRCYYTISRSTKYDALYFLRKLVINHSSLQTARLKSTCLVYRFDNRCFNVEMPAWYIAKWLWAVFITLNLCLKVLSSQYVLKE